MRGTQSKIVTNAYIYRITDDCMAERVGFEPTRAFKALPIFEIGTFNHSDTSPRRESLYQPPRWAP